MKRFSAFLPASAAVALALVAGSFSSRIAPSATAAEPEIRLDPIYENLEIERPVVLKIPGDGTNRRFLVEQTGKIKILPADENGTEAKVFFDGTESIGVEKDFEEGMLGLAFHPRFAENGRLFLAFSRQGPKRLVVAEYRVLADDPDRLDPDSEKILLEVQQPEWNHNSGNLLFDPRDGLLYIAVGDGGFKNGVFMLPQKLTRHNGKLLRIDVDGGDAKHPYGIPEDNPFAGDPLACPEIFAYGLRNPWGIWVDEEAGLFYLADVGQDLYEEINLIEKGGNYGWEFREGAHEFAVRAAYMKLVGKKPDPPKGAEFIDPIHEYGRADGLSITGGFVYRGSALAGLEGTFLYGDWRLGNLWALHYDPEQGKVTANHELHRPEDPSEPVVQPTGFYPDEKGEPIVLGWKGKMFRMVPAGD